MADAKGDDVFLQRLHLFRPSGQLCRRAQQYRDHRAGGYPGPCARVSPHFQDRLRASLRRSTSSATCAAWACWAASRAGPDLEEKRYEAYAHFGQKLDDACEKRGLLLRPLINMAVFSPPLIITKAQIDEMFDIMEAGLEEISAEYDV